jgi:hypothetical protein
MRPHSKADGTALATIAVLLFMAGIDGFQLLEGLKELGSRPFFLALALPTIYFGTSGRLLLSIGWLQGVAAIVGISTTGFIIFGSSQPPIQQFLAHGSLFLIGFSPLIFRLKFSINEQMVVRAAVLALVAHLIFVAIDQEAIYAGRNRPFEGIFLGSVGREVPTGLFSEPSYLAAYIGMLLPICLHRSKPIVVAFCTAIAGFLFFAAGVRSFFIVYGAALFVLITVRWGISSKTLLVFVLGGALITAVGANLSLFSVEESLSSAYRLGNSLSYFTHAISHDLFIGDGFGASHFLYRDINHPDFMKLSNEYAEMLGGTGARVPIFNLWIRMFVEIGVLPTIIFLAVILKYFFSKRIMAMGKVFFAGNFMLTLSTDSYIYGMFTLSLLLIFSMRNDISAAPADSLRKKLNRRSSTKVLQQPQMLVMPSGLNESKE